MVSMLCHAILTIIFFFFAMHFICAGTVEDVFAHRSCAIRSVEYLALRSLVACDLLTSFHQTDGSAPRHT